ncbi:hypothetical protein P389DRAFT_165993 [Cystobasidium minutum MCA 4210]|uniref:uncharacterized protein n=1 Tax=Cystobasidium minutum MCA 4210 TaxID=1397322 RepID=UPI0034CDE1B3|eukprot:jgi/Rhomi1/165993/fgenesh1_kg.1_\
MVDSKETRQSTMMATVLAPPSYMQVFKIATISSVQILVLVIAGTSGFIVSLLGLLVPDAFKGGQSKSTPSISRASSVRSLSRRRNRSTSPTATTTASSSRRTSSPPSLRRGIVSKKASIENGLHSILDTAENARSIPLSRGNSSTSTSTIPELAGHSTTPVTSCSSSISEGAPIAPTPSHHLHHGLSANALYEGLVNKYKAKKAATCKKQDSSTSNVHASVPASSEDLAAHSRTSTRRASISATGAPSSPRLSHEGMRHRLSSLIIPHSQQAGHASSISKKRLSLDAHMLSREATSAQMSPILSSPEESSVKSATSQDTMITIAEKDVHNAVKPPFLSRMFTFSSHSSSSSSCSSKPKSASSASTSSTDISDGSVSISTDGHTHRPRARRLSTRLVNFRSMSNNGPKSRRAISESSDQQPLHLAHFLPAEKGSEEGIAAAQDAQLASPPQTPKLGSLPSSSDPAHWTPGSNASPLRSPLSKRSFFGTSSPSKISSSPSSGSTLTPRSNNVQQQQQRLAKGASPHRRKVERPVLEKRSVSDNHTSWKSWVGMTSSSSSPARASLDRRGTVSASVGHITTTSSDGGADTDKTDAMTVTAGDGQVKHARHVSDHAVLSSGRALPVASISHSAVQGAQSKAGQQKYRQSVSRRALSFAPPPSHAVLVPLSSSTAAYMNTNTHVGKQQQQQLYPPQQQRQISVKGQQQAVFVPFHPFLDERYRESSLDLSGTTSLTMEVHFGGDASAPKAI